MEPAGAFPRLAARQVTSRRPHAQVSHRLAISSPMSEWEASPLAAFRYPERMTTVSISNTTEIRSTQRALARRNALGVPKNVARVVLRLDLP